MNVSIPVKEYEMKRICMICLISVCIVLSVSAKGKTDEASYADMTQQGSEAASADAGPQSIEAAESLQPETNAAQMPPDFPGEGQFGGMMPDREPPVNTALSNISSRSIIDDPSDIAESASFVKTFSVDVGKKTTDSDGKEVSAVFTDNGLEITSTSKDPVKLILSGSMKGTISIEKGAGDIALVLNTLSVTAQDGPALMSNSKYKTYIVLEKGTANTLTDSKERDKNTKKGALYAKGALIFSGSGSLSVDASYKNGIYSDDYISIKSGTISVAVSTRDAVRCINGFIMSDGNLSITGTGSAIDEESKGIKVDGAENEKYCGEGFIAISGGSITINTVGKAMTASWEKEEDSETQTPADDPNSYVLISGGNIGIVTTAEPYEYENEDGVTVSCSPEGIEAKTDLLITGGKINIKTSDDCLNAGISIHISGGDITVKSTDNDAIDSNGALTISGGIINAQGGRSPETAFDSDMYPFSITGGTIFGAGGTNMSYPVQEVGSQNTLIIFSQLTAGKKLKITDSNNREVFSADIDSWFGSAVISSPVFQKGLTYTLYSGDTKIESFTIENSTTMIGQNSERGFGGFTGGMGNPPEGMPQFEGTFPPEGNRPLDGTRPDSNGNFKGGRKGMTPPNGQTSPQTKTDNSTKTEL